jgi:hypothetical protein
MFETEVVTFIPRIAINLLLIEFGRGSRTSRLHTRCRGIILRGIQEIQEKCFFVGDSIMGFISAIGFGMVVGLIRLRVQSMQDFLLFNSLNKIAKYMGFSTSS